MQIGARALSGLADCIDKLDSTFERFHNEGHASSQYTRRTSSRHSVVRRNELPVIIGRMVFTFPKLIRLLQRRRATLRPDCLQRWFPFDATFMSKPYRDVFAITEGDGTEKKSHWTKIGVAYPNRDGSETAYLDALPVNGKIMIRDPKPKEAQPA